MAEESVTDALAKRVPVTPAVVAYFHQDEYVRDVPQSCICTWQWFPGAAAWMRIGVQAHCIWHHLSRNGRCRRQRRYSRDVA